MNLVKSCKRGTDSQVYLMWYDLTPNFAAMAQSWHLCRFHCIYSGEAKDAIRGQKRMHLAITERTVTACERVLNDESVLVRVGAWMGLDCPADV